jgi:hypothetical protein
MEDQSPTPEQQATADAALMELLQAKRAIASKQVLADVKTGEDAAEQEAFTITTDVRVPMNRAERRAQVRMYAKVLAESERQRPIVNPTIIPRQTRRANRSRRAH